MTRHLKWFVFLLTVCLVSIPVTAKEVVTLKWATCCAQQDRHVLFQQWARRFEAKNPDIKIEWEFPAGSYSTVLATRIAGGSGPDVMWIGGDFSMMQDMFSSIDDMKAQANGPFKDAMPSIFPLFSWQGKLRAAPYGANTVPFYVNQRIFNEVGLPMPKSSWTWQDLISMGKRLTRDSNGDGQADKFALDFRPGGYELTAMSWGSAPYTPDGRKATFNNPITTAALQMFADFTSNRYGQLLAPTGVGGSYIEQLSSQTGITAIVAGGVWAVPTLRNLPSDEWEAITFPWLEVGGKKYRNHYISGEAWAIVNTTKHPAEARRFVEFLLDKEQMSEFARSGAIIPVQAPVARQFFTPTSSKPKNMAAFLEALDDSNPLLTNHPVGKAIYTATQGVRSQVLAGNASADAALAEMERIANQMLDEFWTKK